MAVRHPLQAADALHGVNFVNRKVMRQLVLRCNTCDAEGTPEFWFLPVKHYERLGVSPLRENIFCAQCRSTQRTRALLATALDVMANEGRDDLAILDTDDSWRGGTKIGLAGNRVATTFNEKLPWGHVNAWGVRNEDLSALTFDDDTFDVVVSSEVHEHIEDTWRAFSEVLRVLRPGGTYVFTVPFSPTLATTARLGFHTDAGELWAFWEHLHIDPRAKGGIPAYWLFGDDLVSRLAVIGFATEQRNAVPPGSPPVQVPVFVARKA